MTRNFRCPVCGSTDVTENLLYAWSMKCNFCGWFTNEYK